MKLRKALSSIRLSLHRVCALLLAKYFGLYVPSSITDPNGIMAVGAEIGDEKYIILFRNFQEEEAIQAIGRWANDEELDFDWDDAKGNGGEFEGVSGNC